MSRQGRTPVPRLGLVPCRKQRGAPATIMEALRHAIYLACQSDISRFDGRGAAGYGRCSCPRRRALLCAFHEAPPNRCDTPGRGGRADDTISVQYLQTEK